MPRNLLCTSPSYTANHVTASSRAARAFHFRRLFWRIRRRLRLCARFTARIRLRLRPIACRQYGRFCRPIACRQYGRFCRPIAFRRYGLWAAAMCSFHCAHTPPLAPYCLSAIRSLLFASLRTYCVSVATRASGTYLSTPPLPLG